jgi:beta-glucosidase
MPVRVSMLLNERIFAVARFSLLTVALLSFAVVLPAMPAMAGAQAAQPYMNPSLPIEKRVDDLVSRMTLEEKVSQVIDRAAAIPRLNVPAYNWWNEGLHGIARSGYATVFPQAIANAATWDAPLVGQIGATISTEARAKYNDAIRHDNHDRYYGLTIWSPNINIFRDPRWGRGQETYGEDPFLTSRMGVAFVKGLQGDDPKYLRAIATPKHYAVHSGPESTRHKVNVDPTDHDLWDTYLPAFRATITEGRADSIMCAYNAVDGTPACASDLLLKHILRQDWKFQGFVTSDCDAIDDFSQKDGHHYSTDPVTGSAAGILAGTDTDCGTAYKALEDSVKKGLLTEAQLDVSVKLLFTARFRLGMFDPESSVPFNAIPYSVIDSPEHEELALRASRESMVLLKNEDGFLPLKTGQTVAVIGPLAASRIALEGNYNAVPKKPILPVDGIVDEFGAEKVLYAEGSPYIMGGTVPVPRTLLRTANGEQGLKGEYFADANFAGSPAMARVDKELDFDWASANPAKMSDPNDRTFSVRWTGTISVPVADTYSFQMHLPFCYPCSGKLSYRIFFDGKPLDPVAAPQAMGNGGAVGANGMAAPPERGWAAAPKYSIAFADTNSHEIRIEYSQNGKVNGGGIAFEWSPKHELLQAEAVETAKKADVVVAFVGLTSRLEGEEMKVSAKGFDGGDRTDLVLPDVQQELLEAVAKTGKPMVVVLLNGSALAVNWAQENAKAIVEAWYPGQSGGQAIAETLSGKNNPGGRLPVTFYKSVNDLPAFDDYSMANRTYRYFKGAPLYGFGYGLSYTSFTYSGIKLSTKKLRAGEALTVEADVNNTGGRAGDEVAELYLVPPKTMVSPQLALKGFTRVHLEPGATQHVTFTLDPRTLSQVDAKGVRAVAPGSYRLVLGGGQPSEAKGLSSEFTIEGTQEMPR